MTFADKLKELRARALTGNFHLVLLEQYLANHAAEIEALVRAAELAGAKDSISTHLRLKKALAALNGGKDD